MLSLFEFYNPWAWWFYFQIAELSTQFHNLVPLEGYAYDRIHPLNDKSAIKAQMRLISVLLDLEVASKILLGAQYRSAGEYSLLENEPCHEKTNILHMRKQRRRSASR